MAKEIGKDANAQENAAKAKYIRVYTFRDIYDKVTRPILHTRRDETYKQRTQQNFHSR